eukprot:7622527-Lingulodinium_polyedra.AAC.1
MPEQVSSSGRAGGPAEREAGARGQWFAVRLLSHIRPCARARAGASGDGGLMAGQHYRGARRGAA